MFSNIPLLNNLSDIDKRSLEDFIQSRNLSAGETLFNEGDPANSLYFVTEGKLEVTSNLRTLGFIGVGDIVGEMSVFGTDTTRSATVKSSIDSKLLVIMGFSIKDIGSSNPELLENLKNIITERKNQNNS